MPAFHTAPDPAAIQALAIQLWDQPNRALSTRDELRFGTNGSKSVKPYQGVWFDHEAQEGGHYRDLYRLVNGAFPENGSDKSGFRVPEAMLRELGNPVAWWDYHDVRGQVIGRVVRFHPTGLPKDEDGKPGKTFRQCRPEGDGWKWKMDGVALPLYRAPSLSRAKPGSVVYVTEGERHADRLREWGLIATSNAGGAGKFTAAHARALAGFRVVILADNDAAGAKHSAAVLRLLAAAKVEARAIELPALPPKGDILDWIKAGGTRDQLDALMTEAWKPIEEPSRKFGRLQIRSVQDALDAPPRTYLLEGLMAPGELSVWWGAPKSGKSFLMLRIAYGMAQGKGIWGREAAKVPVLYIAAEGASGVNGRIRALHETLGHTDDFHHVAQSIDLFDPEADLSDLIAAIKALKCKLVVPDTLARVMGAGDENATRDMNVFVRNCDTIREETGAHVAVVHHGGWDATHMRGSIALLGAADIVMKVTGKRDEPHQVEVEYAKDDADGDVMGFRLAVHELPPLPNGKPRSTCIAHETDATAAPSRARRGKINEEAETLLREVETAIAAGAGSNMSPEPGMQPCPTLHRPIFQPILIQRGWLRLANGLAKTSGETASQERIPQTEHDRLYKKLNHLRLKGLIGFNRFYVWLPKAPTSP